MISARASIGTLHYMDQTIYKAEKALVAAKFNGLELATKKFDYNKDSKKPEFVAKNPMGKVPFLETETGCMWSSNAIARYVARCRADTPLFGMCFNDEGKIDTWLEFGINELEVPLMTWAYLMLGTAEEAPQAIATAQSDVERALTVLESQLKTSEFLIGDFLSLADIAIVCALREGFQRIFDPAFRKPYPKVCAWFESCCDMPEFKSVMGDVKLCTQADKANPFTPSQSEAMATPAKAEAKPEAKTAAATARGAPAAAEGGHADEAAVKAKGDEIRVLKDKLKAEGKKGKEIDKDPQVATLVAELQALKSVAPASQKAAAAPGAAPTEGDIESQVKACGDKIRVLKERLKREGIAGQKLTENPEVMELVAELNELKKKL
jgi:elongation factor 1-gamma